jgi:hypothetical protein
MRGVVNKVLALAWLLTASAGCAYADEQRTAAEGVTSGRPPPAPVAGTAAPEPQPMGLPQPTSAGTRAPSERDDSAEPPPAGSAGPQGAAAGTQGGAAGVSAQAGAGGAVPTPPATPDPPEPDPFDPFAPDAALPPLFPEPAPGDRTPSPDNPPECPAVAPDNPIGPCVGLPVYLECSYGTYFCVCDWIHWLCAG